MFCLPLAPHIFRICAPASSTTCSGKCIAVFITSIAKIRDFWLGKKSARFREVTGIRHYSCISNGSAVRSAVQVAGTDVSDKILVGYVRLKLCVVFPARKIHFSGPRTIQTTSGYHDGKVWLALQLGDYFHRMRDPHKNSLLQGMSSSREEIRGNCFHKAFYYRLVEYCMTDSGPRAIILILCILLKSSTPDCFPLLPSGVVQVNFHSDIFTNEICTRC